MMVGPALALTVLGALFIHSADEPARADEGNNDEYRIQQGFAIAQFHSIWPARTARLSAWAAIS
jgi:hypothetical protein